MICLKNVVLTLALASMAWCQPDGGDNATISISSWEFMQLGVDVAFQLNVTGGTEPYSFSWRFGDGTGSEEQNPSVTYESPGSYDVIVVVSDVEDETVSDTVTINVTEFDIPEKTSQLRIGIYNTALSDVVGRVDGALAEALATTNFPQAVAVAEIVQRTNPDILCLNEFDHLWVDNDNWDKEGTKQMVQNFKSNYLEVPQYENAEPVVYDFMYVAPCNTGVQSGFDLDNNGMVGGGGDAFGFGDFPGAFSMAFLSKYPIEESMIRTFQYFLWKDMPDAYLPPDPNDTSGDGMNSFYNETELEVFRLSSKSHWDIPVDVDGELVHVLLSHPTPPVFDDGTATEFPSSEVADWNGLRNHDEIRFFADYVTPGQNAYIYDDAEWLAAGGTTPEIPSGGFVGGERWVFTGDQNADPIDGDSTFNPIALVLDSPLADTSMTPGSLGAEEQAPPNNNERETKTADFGLRVDYCVPSVEGFNVQDAFVVWPRTTDVEASWLQTSDHFMVVADVDILGEGVTAAPVAPTDAPPSNSPNSPSEAPAAPPSDAPSSAETKLSLSLASIVAFVGTFVGAI